MARKKLRSETEWLVTAKRRAGKNAHSVIVYRQKFFLDDVTGARTMQRLWVVARGYAGRGDCEEYSAVMYPEGEESRIVGCDYACPDPENFDEDDRALITAEDYDVIESLWKRAGRLAIYDLEQLEPTFTVNVDIPKSADHACSENWNGDLLSLVSEQWPLSTQF